MTRIWAPEDPKPPSTIEGDAIPKDAHVGVAWTALLAGPEVLYAATEKGFVNSRVMEVSIVNYLPGGFSPSHTHADMEKVYVVVAGLARITVGDESRVLGPGSLAHIPVGLPHGFENVGEDVLRIGAIFAFLREPVGPA